MNRREMLSASAKALAVLTIGGSAANASPSSLDGRPCVIGFDRVKFEDGTFSATTWAEVESDWDGRFAAGNALLKTPGVTRVEIVGSDHYSVSAGPFRKAKVRAYFVPVRWKLGLVVVPKAI